MSLKRSTPALTSSSSTTFTAALIVPALAKACGAALERREPPQIPGYGLKQLRLLCKDGRAAVQKAVHGYTLKLRGTETLELPVLAAFLNSSQLRLLRLKIPLLKTSNDEVSSVVSASAILSSQLNAFIASTGHALSGVVHLDISLASNKGSSERQQAAIKAITTMLIPLTAACPQLQHLSVTGTVGAKFLHAAGSRCPKLTHFEADLTHLSPNSHSNLSIFLPNVTSLTTRDPSISRTGPAQQKAKIAAAILTTLKSSPSLRTLDLGSFVITEDIWLALPAGLHSLCCTAPRDISKGDWPIHASMRKLGLTNMCVDVSTLATLLTAAPGVVVLAMEEKLFVNATFSRDDALDLQYLDSRLSGGLTLTLGAQFDKEDRKAGRHKDLSLVFKVQVGTRAVTDKGLDDYEHDMPTFMAAAIMNKPLHSFKLVDFNNEEGEQDEGELVDLSHLPRIFPNIEHLCVTNMNVEPGALEALLACKSLRTVRFETVDHFSGTDLRILCSGAKVLESVYLCQCRGVSIKEEERIHEEGDKLYGVDIEIDRGDMLYEEDDRHDWQRERWGSSGSEDGDDSSREGDSSDEEGDSD